MFDMQGRKWRCGINVVIRLVHTALCVSVPTTLLWKDTGLRRSLVNLEDPLYGALYFLLLVCSLTLYYMACFIDPGYVPVNRVNKHKNVVTVSVSSSEGTDEEDVENGVSHDRQLINNACKYRHCDYCEIEQPMRSKHCEDCNCCVRKYDHHCPWLEACVGERNHKYFWFFLLTMSVLIPWTLCITWRGFTLKLTWTGWFKENIILFLDVLVLVFGGLVVFGLFCFHTYLMVKGLTTWETASRERITYLKYLDQEYNPFDEGIIKNIYYFLFFCKIRKWEVIYAKKARFRKGGVV